VKIELPDARDRAVTAVLAQLADRVGAVDANARRAAEVIHDHPGADLVVFPELFLTGYALDVAESLAVDVNEPSVRVVRSACAENGTAAVVGFIERTDSGPRNSIMVIGADGALVGVRRKQMLFADEQRIFRDADEPVGTVRLGDLTIGTMVCFDVEFPEIARSLGRAGAVLLVTSAANMHPFFADHELASRARALDNRVPHIYVNAVGSGSGNTYVGGSRAIAPDGSVLVELGDAEEVCELRVPIGTGVEPDVDYLRRLEAWRGGDGVTPPGSRSLSRAFPR